ncbi:hypothetical protein KC865_00165 [Candidatus Kaiserbacteria bacterium]|nr:hypothetical protein [Candidatus Kaiserbacteria bacterium]USN91880.1 MAG: hypothetical protein H6782_03330 [Candidatus Nomurabacteria bacterium]
MNRNDRRESDKRKSDLSTPEHIGACSDCGWHNAQGSWIVENGRVVAISCFNEKGVVPPRLDISDPKQCEWYRSGISVD